MYDARSEARKATAAAISSGRAIRRIGTSAAHPSIISYLLFLSHEPRSTAFSSCRAVRVQPGATLLIVTPSAATSFESDLAHPVRPARTVFDSSKPAIGCLTEIDVTLTTRPQRLSRIE